MKLAIIGPGLIGRSIALAARRADPTTHIVEIDRGDSVTTAREADLIVLATPVNVISELIAENADLLRTAVTLDTGSVKQSIVRAARSHGLDRFVGGHPMAGAATSGPGTARADLFDGKPWFLVPHGAAPDAVTVAQAFVTGLRARPVMLDDDGGEHDRVMAAVSHLPQAVASALMTVVAASAGDRLDWAGSGLRDTTRLAASDASVWEGILAANAPHLRPLLLELSSALTRLADQLDDGDAVRMLFAKARESRARLES